MTLRIGATPVWRRQAPRSMGLLLAAAVGVGIVPGAASAHFSAGEYSHKSCPAGATSNRTDPVNLIAYDGATGEKVDNHIAAHTGWGVPAFSGTQYFVSHTSCGAASHERASGELSRYHLRLRKTLHDDTTYGTTTQISAHHENLIYCGHQVDEGFIGYQNWNSGFVLGRNEVWSKMTAGHQYHVGFTANWGNTQVFAQCNTQGAGSDGWVFWMKVV